MSALSRSSIRAASHVARGCRLAFTLGLIAACGGGGSRPGGLRTLSATVSRLSGTGLVLQVNGAGDVAVQANGAVALAQLATGAAYAVTVKAQPVGPAQICTVAAGEGTVGGADVSDVAVTCRSWSEAAGVGGTAYDAIAFAMNAAGAGVAVWAEAGGPATAAHFTSVTGWGAPEPIQTVAGAASGAKVAMDAAGNAIAVWDHHDPADYLATEVWFNRYTPGSGWGAAARLDDEGVGLTHEPDVAMSASGRAIAVWTRYDFLGGSRVWSKVWVPGAGWSAGARVDANVDEVSYQARIAADGAGNGLAVWWQTPTPRLQQGVWSRRYDAATGWGEVRLVDDHEVDRECRGLQVSMNVKGDALVAWSEVKPSAGRVCARTYAAATGWNAAQILGGDDVRADRPAAAIGGRGEALVVWAQEDDTGTHLWSRRHGAGSSVAWSEAQLAAPGSAVAELAPGLAADASGNAVAVWLQMEGLQRDVWFDVYSAGKGWAGAQRLCPAADERDLPVVAMSSEGDGIALWTEVQAIRASAFR